MFIYVFISFVLLVELKKIYMNIQKSPVVEVFFEVGGGKCVSVCTSFLSSFLFSLPYFYCRIVSFPPFSSFFFVVVCLFLSWFGCVLFFLLFFFFFFYTPVSIGLSKPSFIYTYIRIHLCVLSVYSAGQIFPSFSFLHKF